MVGLRRARSSFVLGLIVILFTYNLAYANTNVNEVTGSQPNKVRTASLNNDGATTPITNDAGTSTTRSTKKNVLTIEKSKTAAAGCACSCSSKSGRAAGAPGRWWDCVKGCLRSWGVSVVQLAMCAAACGTGNIPICVICLGVDVSLMIFCSLGCEVYAGSIDGSDEGYEPILVRKLPRNGKKKPGNRTLGYVARK